MEEQNQNKIDGNKKSIPVDCKVSPLFLYDKSEALPPKFLRAIKKAGYTPIPVASLENIKIISPLDKEASNELIRIALETVNNSDWDHKPFGKAVIKMLAG